ncbi:MAG: phenylalanine--tRNA ligase subunit beta [Chlamydiae bacterium]|nr:phenylalanine--tRNA ligase subunit beta [Chlamydiota bacterium]
MKFPLSWFKSFLATKRPPKEIADRLTMLGFEVEAIEPFGVNFAGVVVAEVVETKPHPEADKLTIAQVCDGTETVQVVCAAKNCRVGIRTAFAKVGGRVGDIEISARKLRGIESFGMLCGHDELDLPKNCPGGIMELDESFTVGRHLGCYFGDLIFDVALTPNLAYAMSVRGIAHELGAFLKERAFEPSFKVECKGKRKLRVKSQTLRYGCRIIENVKVAPSPDWLTARLEACGLRPINNIVDVTNYVMLECGQPMHAFDLDKIDGNIDVRFAHEGEKIETLDGKQRSLKSDMLLIADEKKAIAVAGVMGGANSEVSNSTQNIVLEAAYFDPSSVRKTAKRLELSTDASYRFERGSDPNCLEDALDQAAALILEIAGGTASPSVIEGKPLEDKKLSLRVSRVNQLLGTQLAIGEVEEILRSINLKVSTKEGVCTVNAPFGRHDLNGEIDLVEEVARFYGYENIANDRPTLYRGHSGEDFPGYSFQQRIRELLLQEGLQELLTCDLISPKEAAILEQESLIHLQNPHSIEQSVLRPSLLPSLMKVVQHNIDHSLPDIAGFEIGKLHLKEGDNYLEPMVASIVLHGKRSPAHFSEKEQNVDFFDLKGIAENLLRQLHIEGRFVASKHVALHPLQQAALIVDDKEVGVLGQLHPAHMEGLFFLELQLDDLQLATKTVQKMEPLPQFPSSHRDLTITVPESLEVQTLFDAVTEAKTNCLEEISLIDVYRGDKLGSGVKNMTFRFVYRDSKQTLSLEEVESEHAELTNQIRGKL